MIRMLKSLFRGASESNEDPDLLKRYSDLLERYPDFLERMARLKHELFDEALHDPSQATVGLFSLLVSHAFRFDGASFEDETDLLERVRDRAWIGYRDLPLLIQTMESEASDGQPLRFLGAVAEQKASWLFLPIVYVIARRYGATIPPELHAEGLLKDHRNLQTGRMLAALAPGDSKIDLHLRATMLTALFLVPKLPDSGNIDVFLVVIRDELRIRYHAGPITPQEALRRKTNAMVALAGGLCADEISRVAGGALWVEALFVIERRLYGVNQPQLDQFMEIRLIDRPQG